jgi:hypothetical protein
MLICPTSPGSRSARSPGPPLDALCCLTRATRGRPPRFARVRPPDSARSRFPIQPTSPPDLSFVRGFDLLAARSISCSLAVRPAPAEIRSISLRGCFARLERQAPVLPARWFRSEVKKNQKKCYPRHYVIPTIREDGAEGGASEVGGRWTLCGLILPYEWGPDERAY